MTKYQDLTGQAYGSLTVIQRTFSTNKQTYFLCVCKCGEKKSVYSGHLKRGYITSCKRCSEHFKHGMLNTPTYESWRAMKARCLDKNHMSYHRYGARGITICEEWINNFKQFLADMGERLSKQHSLDRIDNNKGYSPDNCKWSTKKEQSNNTIQNVNYLLNGRQYTRTQLCLELNINLNTFFRKEKRCYPYPAGVVRVNG